MFASIAAYSSVLVNVMVNVMVDVMVDVGDTNIRRN
jgi:hypothetical protein